MQHIGIAIAALGFWAFLTASAVAGIVADYKKRHLELEPLRAAIERGQQLDPAIVERLMAREQKKSLRSARQTSERFSRSQSAAIPLPSRSWCDVGSRGCAICCDGCVAIRPWRTIWRNRYSFRPGAPSAISDLPTHLALGCAAWQ
jgi:hypothetical protein